MKQTIITLLGTCLLWTSCSGGGGSDDTPEISKDFINVPPSAEIYWEGGTQDITVSSNCNWTITNNTSWLSVSPKSGNNSQVISITAGKNDTGNQRVGTLTIKGGNAPQRTLTVTQKASPETAVKTMTTDKKALEFDYEESTNSFTITSNTTWTIACPEWCKATPFSGSNNGSITVTAGKNSSKESRTGTIEVKGDDVASISITFSQKGNISSSQSEPGAGDNLPPSN